MPNGGWTNAEEVAILKWYFGTAVKTPDTTLYVALCTQEPNDDGTFVEVDYTEYARQEITNAQWDEAGAIGGDPSYIANDIDIIFDAPVGAAPIPSIVTHFVLLDSLTLSGPTNMKFSGKIVQPPAGLDIQVGTQPQFDAGALRAQLGSDAPA